jgi:hypothetical protein
MHRKLGRRTAGLLAALAALSLVGCFTVGRSFPTKPVGRLAIGSTTQDQVRDMFGEPWRTGVEDGQRTWTYGHYRYTMLGTARTRDLVVRFDDRNVVASYTFNSTEPGDAP